MRKSLCLTLAVLMLICLLAGCGTGGVPAPVGPNTEPTQPAVEDTTSNTEPEGPGEGVPMPQNPIGTYEEYDPDRKYYVMTGGVEATAYENVYVYIFEIMSKEKLETTNISVSFSGESEYAVEVYDHGIDYRDTEYRNGTDDRFLPFYVYQNYCGVDFSLMGKLYDWMMNPPDPDSEEAEEMKKVTEGRSVRAVYEELLNTGLDDFAALEPEDTKEFYIYSVWVTFNFSVEETITQMEVTINGETFLENIGTLHLIPGAFPISYSWPEEPLWLGQVGAGTHYFPTVYGDGITKSFVHDAVAGADMNLESFQILGDDFELLDIIVQITTDGNTVSMKWDGKSPIPVYEGDHVYIEVVTKNALLARLSYEAVMNYELVYSHNGQKFSDYNRPQFKPSINYHAIYAVVFDGLNMEPYYRDYYYLIYQEWQNEYE